MSAHSPGPWLARTMYLGSSDPGIPYVSQGDSARVLCLMNLSGAYNGYAGIEQARADATVMSLGPEMLAVLRDVAALLPVAGRLHPRDLAALQTRVVDVIAKATTP